MVDMLTHYKNGGIELSGGGKLYMGLLTSIYLYFNIRMLFNILILVYTVALLIAHFVITKKKKSTRIWRILCFVPLVFSIIQFCIMRFSSLSVTFEYYGYMYISAVIIALWQFFANKKVVYRIVSVIVILSIGVLSCLGIWYSVMTPVLGNFSREDYVTCFESIIQEMKENYPLNEWKEIDYDEIRDKILPEVIAAQENEDKVGFYVALLKYCHYFYDGHVGVSNYKVDVGVINEAMERMAGNDYGFSMVRLDNGQTVAILVDEESLAYELGIRNGTVITKWDGEDVTVVQDTVECIYPYYYFTVKENEDKVKAMFLAGKGGNEITVTYVNATGNEENVNLNSIGNYAARLNKALVKFHSIPETEDFLNDNFKCSMLTHNVGLLQINYEEYYDSSFNPIYDNELISDILINRLEELENQGMKKLIIDMRNNIGGRLDVESLVVSIFTNDTFLNFGAGKYLNGKYKILDRGCVSGKGIYSNLESVVLVNSRTLSGGDLIAYHLSKAPNTTIMGFTTSSNSAQGKGGECYTTEEEFLLEYPYILNVDEDLQPMIDSDASREATIKLDEKIPLTMESIDIIWGDSDVDYELQYAIDYLSK